MRGIGLLVLSLLLMGSFAFSKKKEAKEEMALGVFYFSPPMFGHIYQLPSIDSVSLTTLSCGHPLRVYPAKEGLARSESLWKRVKTVGIEGYVQAKYLFKKKKSCIQDRYPKFFNALSFSVTEMYYLGRLSSLYIDGQSKVKRP